MVGRCNVYILLHTICRNINWTVKLSRLLCQCLTCVAGLAPTGPDSNLPPVLSLQDPPVPASQGGRLWPGDLQGQAADGVGPGLLADSGPLVWENGNVLEGASQQEVKDVIDQLQLDKLLQ